MSSKSILKRGKSMISISKESEIHNELMNKMKIGRDVLSDNDSEIIFQLS